MNTPPIQTPIQINSVQYILSMTSAGPAVAVDESTRTIEINGGTTREHRAQMTGQWLLSIVQNAGNQGESVIELAQDLMLVHSTNAAASQWLGLSPSASTQTQRTPEINPCPSPPSPPSPSSPSQHSS